MNKHSRMRFSKIVHFIVVLLAITLVLALNIYLQKEQAEQATEECNSLYGEDNYVWVEYRRDFIKCGYSECWKCELKGDTYGSN